MFFFKFLNNPFVFLYIAIALSIVSLCFRALFLRSLINFKIINFMRYTILPIVILFSLNLFLFFFLKGYLGISSEIF